MFKKSVVFMWLMCLGLVAGLASSSFAEWGSKDLETEKIAVNFAKEVIKGGYKIVTTSGNRTFFSGIQGFCGEFRFRRGYCFRRNAE